MIFLPSDYKLLMKQLLEDDYQSFIKTYNHPITRSLRVNVLKVSPEQLKKQTPFHLRSIPWVKEGFYYDSNRDQPGKHLYHNLGLYYIQEASAMAPVEALDPQPNERILDLCAAPGGKTTQIAAKMQGKGILVANEIDPVRTKALVENIDRCGVTNAVILNEKPSSLRAPFRSFFDRILVDAPCSGEGMFHKDHESCKNWSLRLIERCAEVQSDILDTAAAMLRPGGRIVYSTCTFNPTENEGTIELFLEKHPEFRLNSIAQKEHYQSGLDPEGFTARLWPHHLKGEGHFVAVMEKEDKKEVRKRVKQDQYEKGEKLDTIKHFFQETLHIPFPEPILIEGENVYVPPDDLPSLKGLRVKRPGRHLGTTRKGYFVPSHAFALSLNPKDVKQTIDYALKEKDLHRYLQGETLSTSLANGWTLLSVDGFSLGWGKMSAGTLKNHYPKSLRWNKEWFNF